MATLQEQFEQARTAAVQRRAAPTHAQAASSIDRLDELESRASDARSDPVEREAAMRHFIQLVGELGQQDG